MIEIFMSVRNSRSRHKTTIPPECLFEKRGFALPLSARKGGNHAAPSVSVRIRPEIFFLSGDRRAVRLGEPFFRPARKRLPGVFFLQNPTLH
ncbi:MAG: hypothetical protein ACI4P3_06505, partial [Candidatus Spyradosoma sp.]